jgi:hypothetical protein
LRRENQNSKTQHRLKADNSKFKIQNSKFKIQNCAFGAWGFIMKKYNKPMIAVRYVDIQGICAGSQVQIGPGYANEDACSKGNTTQLSIRDVWEDK